MNLSWLVWPITVRVHCHANETLSVVKVGERRESGTLYLLLTARVKGRVNDILYDVNGTR